MIYFLTLHLKPWWKYLQEFFFLSFLIFFSSWGQFCSCTRRKHVRRRWKPSPSYRSCHHISKKATLLSAFLTWSQFPSILAPLSEPGPCQQLGVDEAKKKKKTSQVKFKDVFLLEAGPCCYKPKETFSCSTFFMVSPRVSSLPSSLHLGSTVTYCCTGCRPRPAGHHRREWGGWGGGGGCSSSLMEPGQKFCLVDLLWLWWTSCLDSIDLRRLSPPFTSNAQPENSEPMANSNQSGAWSPPTHRPGFNVATKENILMQAADCSPGPTLCATCYNLWRAQRFAINWGCETVRLPAHVCSGQLHWVMHTVCVCVGGRRVGGGLQLRSDHPPRYKHKREDIKCIFISLELQSAASFQLAACRPSMCSVPASNPFDVCKRESESLALAFRSTGLAILSARAPE